MAHQGRFWLGLAASQCDAGVKSDGFGTRKARREAPASLPKAGVKPQAKRPDSFPVPIIETFEDRNRARPSREAHPYSAPSLSSTRNPSPAPNPLITKGKIAQGRLAEHSPELGKIEIEVTLARSGGLFYCRLKGAVPKMSAQISKVRLCAEILPNRRQCTQFALRNQPFCRNHADKNRRDQTAAARQLVATIPGMDLFQVAVTLFDILFLLRRKQMPPLHAYSTCEAAARRIEFIMAEEAPAHFARVESEAGHNPRPHNGLQAAPMKCMDYSFHPFPFPQLPSKESLTTLFNRMNGLQIFSENGGLSSF
jgi:hypothetical protein